MTTMRRILTDDAHHRRGGLVAQAGPASHRVAAFLKRKGYRVIPVNPGQAGQEALGEVVRASAWPRSGSRWTWWISFAAAKRRGRWWMRRWRICRG
jgi:hypothetical protein